jgi:hypothetical protein
MPPKPLDAVLAEFKPDDYTARMLDAVFKVVPYSPPMPFYRVVDDAVRAMTPAGQPFNPVLGAKARQYANDQDLQDVLWMSRLLDTGDKGYALFTGLSSVVGLVRGQGSDALETDTQQRNDAVMKALGIGYMAYNAFPGSIAERAEAFRTTPAGQAMTLYFAAIEVALPFADNAAVSGGNFIQGLLAKDGPAASSKLASLAGGKSLEGAMGMVSSMAGGIQRVVDHASKYTKPIAETASKHMPGALNAADKAAGMVANMADIMPVYTYLGARLAVEGAVYRAMKAP